MIFDAHRLPPASAYLFSYPRSGSNWLFSALAYLSDGIKAEARIGPELYPHTYGQVGAESFWIQAASRWQEGRPLLIKSHESTEIVGALYPEGKKLYLLRDGRDVLISYYFYSKAFIANPGNKTVFAAGRSQQDLGAISGNEVRFDSGEYSAFLREHAPAWVRHTQTWLAAPGVFAIRYEELQRNFAGELARIATHLELPLVRSVEEVSAEYVEHTRALFAGDNRAFHRKGIVGDWKNYADPDVRASLSAELGEALLALGYERDLQW